MAQGSDLGGQVAIVTGGEGPVVWCTHGRLGHVRLNRPAAINALNMEMVCLVQRALDELESDPDVAVIVIDGAGERGFCAGGDIRAMYEAALVGDRAPSQFWAEEYRLNARLARFPKPIVAIMDGITMGGGVGLAAHVSHPVVTDRAVVAMPEVGIGFAPDVGGTWLLSRAPGETGTHVALTAARLGAADALFCGLAHHHIPATALNDLMAALQDGSVDAAIGSVRSHPGPSQLQAARPWIDDCYSADTVEEVVRRLDEAGTAAAAEIRAQSPTSLKVTFRALREARELPSLERCLEMEHRISTTFLDTPDFVEGVRAAVVDKDRTPRWTPSELSAVTDAEVDRFFAARPDELCLAPVDRG